MGDYKKDQKMVYIITTVYFILAIISNLFLDIKVPNGDFTNAILKFNFKVFTIASVVSIFVTLVICYFLCIGNNIVKNIMTALLCLEMFFMLLEVLNGIEYKSFKVGNWFALVEFLISLIIVILLNKNKNVKCFFSEKKKATHSINKI
ncbi:hypothetical protein [Clostridium botulinum]|uniref:hypothetical protein n=1 Tax=Clostridium botulinum TaxID=1491 RepID=UPI00035BB239|nr:hypothetical protein [Clostridium botulinum]EPS49927.1 hypothetical protein CFSAN002367_13739 [Clostridium botulinum CFSAN002367]AWB29651.1 hypothetical protein DBN47_05100 [Clostridium botulinum]KON10605.1 hypothetical protein ACP52_04180 [Clostridium botulinum]KOR54191.1 hypothetical protein ADT23_04605 [Clostridium botulinum]MBY6831061.1 hypothetical protein [Clostridium botulinum]